MKKLAALRSEDLLFIRLERVIAENRGKFRSRDKADAWTAGGHENHTRELRSKDAENGMEAGGPKWAPLDSGISSNGLTFQYLCAGNPLSHGPATVKPSIRAGRCHFERQSSRSKTVTPSLCPTYRRGRSNGTLLDRSLILRRGRARVEIRYRSPRDFYARLCRNDPSERVVGTKNSVPDWIKYFSNDTCRSDANLRNRKTNFRDRKRNSRRIRFHECGKGNW